MLLFGQMLPLVGIGIPIKCFMLKCSDKYLNTIQEWFDEIINVNFTIKIV